MAWKSPSSQIPCPSWMWGAECTPVKLLFKEGTPSGCKVRKYWSKGDPCSPIPSNSAVPQIFFFLWISSCLLHKMDSVQTMSSSSLFCILLISYWITLVLIYWILPWKQNYSFSCVFFSETLITTVSKFIKTCNHTLVCLHLIDVELSHEGIIKCLFQFWAISDFSVSLTPYITFCVHCVPHHLFLVQPRLSSSHVPRVSLRNPKIKFRCQGSVVKVWDIWVTHH